MFAPEHTGMGPALPVPHSRGYRRFRVEPMDTNPGPLKGSAACVHRVFVQPRADDDIRCANETDLFGRKDRPAPELATLPGTVIIKKRDDLGGCATEGLSKLERVPPCAEDHDPAPGE